jgi:hypothetical protein
MRRSSSLLIAVAVATAACGKQADSSPNTIGGDTNVPDLSAAVGDQYVLTKSDGVKITRTVKSVSTTDDFPYGFLLIKVIKVEQDSRVPGVKAFRYYANHKFGIVRFEIVNDDDSVVAFPIYHSNL